MNKSKRFISKIEISSTNLINILTYNLFHRACDGPEAKFNDVNSTLFFGYQENNFCVKPTLNQNITNCTWLSPNIINDYENCQSQDNRIIYDDFEFETTIATEFDLVCDQQYKVWIILLLLFRIQSFTSFPLR